MKDISIEDITNDQFDGSSQLLISSLRTRYPKLDLRLGTALRDLLVTPDATIQAWFTQQSEEQRKSSSLVELEQRQEDGDEVDADDVNAILSNFNMKSLTGTKASGTIKIVVNEDRVYYIDSEFQFKTSDGVYFATKGSTTASSEPAEGEVELKRIADDAYYFLVEVEAVEVGSNGNISKGEALFMESAFYGFVSASAYSPFSGGTDIESIRAIIDRIPTALSQRGLVTSTATEGQLRDEFDSTRNPIVAVSCCGYGDPAQLRDRHNVLGIGVGGRVDVYVRNFTAIPVETVTLPFTKDGDTYKCTVAPGKVPGLYFVSSVMDAKGGVGSYTFSTEYTSDVSQTWHEFDLENVPVESANTIWRGIKITISDTGLTEDTVNLAVEFVRLPMAKELQDFVDSDAVRNLGSDYVVRCPMICRVFVTAVVRAKSGQEFPVGDAKRLICEYVNTSGFVKRLTRSEITCILKAAGAASVILSGSNMLQGVVIDGTGESHVITGDALDIGVVQMPKQLLTEKTCVFTCREEDIDIEVRDN